LKRIITASNMAGKDDVLAICNNNMNFDEKNAALKKLSSWDDLKNNYLPRLRRTEVYLEGTFPNRDISEVRSIANTSFDGLTKKEVIEYANSATDNASKERAYKYLMNKYPEDWAGVNNYAAIMIREGNYQAGDSLLVIANKQYPNNDTIASNLAVADRYLRKYDDAKSLYTQGSKSLKEGNNLGILYIKYGDYDNAVASFDPKQCDYNTALAYTMKNDYDNALSKIDCITDKTADVYYLRAIVAARKGDVDLMTTSLTLAIQKDPSYRDQAKQDIEFKKYWSKVEFANAIK
jgi:tetratricopeptide (TPR) repeat protein